MVRGQCQQPPLSEKGSPNALQRPGLLEVLSVPCNAQQPLGFPARWLLFCLLPSHLLSVVSTSLSYAYDTPDTRLSISYHSLGPVLELGPKLLHVNMEETEFNIFKKYAQDDAFRKQWKWGLI